MPKESKSRAILWLDTGDPLLVLEQIGRGWSLLLATDPTDSSRTTVPPDRSWSLMASWLNAQPFFESLWKVVIGGRALQRNRQVGQSLQGRWESADVPQKVNLQIPKVPPQQIELVIGPDATWTCGETERVGDYRLSPKGLSGPDSDAPNKNQPPAAEISYAVNLDTSESDLASFAASDLPSIWRQYAREQTDTKQTSASRLAGQSAAAFLLWVVLFLLFVEIFLAWWIGNRFA